jgi:hypothetical protein
MTNLRHHIDAIAREYLDGFKSALGIASPSRAFADVMRGVEWDRAIVDGVSWPPSPPLPWYSVRGSRDVYESPELRAAARRVRRLIRRHWFALMFEPDSDIAWEVRIATASRPRTLGESSLFDEYVQAQKLGLVPHDEPGLIRELFAKLGVDLGNSIAP